MKYEDVIFENGKEYRLVFIRGRGKYIARDGDALNPYKRNQKATICINQDGYPCFGGKIPVHLYVAMAWVDGYQNSYEVNHKDYNRMNYNADNLEWVSHIDNIHYSSDNGRYCAQTGESNGNATTISVYSYDMNLINVFNTIKDCAIWLKDTLSLKSEIKSLYSSISKSIYYNRIYKNLYYFVKNTN